MSTGSQSNTYDRYKLFLPERVGEVGWEDFEALDEYFELFDLSRAQNAVCGGVGLANPFGGRSTRPSEAKRALAEVRASPSRSMEWMNALLPPTEAREEKSVHRVFPRFQLLGVK